MQPLPVPRLPPRPAEGARQDDALGGVHWHGVKNKQTKNKQCFPSQKNSEKKGHLLNGTTRRSLQKKPENQCSSALARPLAGGGAHATITTTTTVYDDESV